MSKIKLMKKIEEIEKLVGNTPLVKLSHNLINLYGKLEYQNFMGSIKARPAFYILKSAILKGEIDEHTTIIESTSGNFGIALASLCKILGISFIPVIDPNINPTYENLLNHLSPRVEKVVERDETGGYLLSRIERVKYLSSEIEKAFWTNQYGNKNNMGAHYNGLGLELTKNFEDLDYAFIAVSSCGTISGVSKRLKENFPNIKVIAVDSVGSVIFGKEPKKRFIPGMGASMVPGLLKEAIIDEVMWVPEEKAIKGCNELFTNHGIFAGGSSGSAYYAINKYFSDKEVVGKPNVVFLCPDNGLAYVDTIYNEKWVEKCFSTLTLMN